MSEAAKTTPVTTVVKTPGAIIMRDNHGVSHFPFLVKRVRRDEGGALVLKSWVANKELLEGKHEIAVWGDCKTDSEGNILKRNDGSLMDWRQGMICAEGYRTLQEHAQINVVSPPEVPDENGNMVGNPHKILDKVIHPGTSAPSYAFLGAIVRKIAWAYGPMGNMVFTDRTMTFTLHEYKRSELVNLAGKNPSAAICGPRTMDIPTMIRAIAEDHNIMCDIEKEKATNDNWKADIERRKMGPKAIDLAVRHAARKTWAFVMIDPLTDTGVWHDTQHPDVYKIDRTYCQSGQFGLRKVEAMCERNVLRAHPLMPNMALDVTKLYRAPDGKWAYRAQVWGHESIESHDEVQRLMLQFSEGLDVATMLKDPGRPDVEIDAEQHPERVRAHEVKAQLVEEEQKQKHTNATASDEPPTEATAETPAPDHDRGELLNDIANLESLIGTEATRKVRRRKKHAAMAAPLTATAEDLLTYHDALDEEFTK